MFCHSNFKLVLWTAVVFASFTFQPAQAKEFLICYENQNFPPYFMRDTEKSDDQVTGILPELLNQAFHSVGMTPTYVSYPWKRCLLLLQQNKVEGVFAAIYLKEREKIGQYPLKNGKEDKSRCLVEAQYSIFAFADNPLHWNGTFSKETTPSIGAPLGYVAVKTLKEKYGIKADTRLTPIVGLNLVSKEQLDGYIVENVSGQAMLRQAGIEDKVSPLSPPFERRYWHLIISHKFYKTHSRVAEAIWDQIKKQREENFSALTEKYLSKISQ